MSTPLEALQQAIAIAGGRKQLSEKIGCKNSTHIGVMITRDKRASAKYVLKISKATGIPTHQLRPDLYEP